MSHALLEPLARWIRRPRGVGAEGGRGPCPHCSRVGERWPSGLEGSPGVLICTGCGGLVSPRGEALELSERTTLLSFAGDRRRDDLPAPAWRPPSPRLDQAVERWVLRRFRRVSDPRLEAYVTALRRKVGAASPGPLLLIDLGEPALAIWPGSRLVLSLGLMAGLDDEAQLAFLLAREEALEQAGWPGRRLAWAHAREREGRLFSAGIEEAAAGTTIELGLKLGFPDRAERAADREALAALVRAGYDPTAGSRALRLVEAASIAGTGGRFLLAADRARWLENRGSGLGPGPGYRLNREVYRRAVGGFSVFASR
ncbi:MAG: hypothetical protein Q9Q40_06035 [Acidobacteriota bacterium]|nr:hypothetical protein [Acidobacteriota bacterium]MDQ7088082.1 hypothetical protein [Acidobacteriota bacterium]